MGAPASSTVSVAVTDFLMPDGLWDALIMLPEYAASKIMTLNYALNELLSCEQTTNCSGAWQGNVHYGQPRPHIDSIPLCELRRLR